MKVLHIIDTLNPGGAERVCVDLTNLLYQKGFQVSVLTITELGSLKALLDTDIELNNLGRKSKFDLRSMFKLRAILQEFDIIHVHMRYTYQYVRLVAIIFGLKKKIILHDHYGGIGVDHRVPFFLNILKPRYYIGVCKELTTWAEQKLRVDPRHVYLLANIVMQAEHIIYPESDTGVLVANFNRIKNHLFAIQLAEKLKFKLVIYGKIIDPLYFQEITEYVHQRGLSEWIIFIHDEIHVQQHLTKYKFGLHTALSESGPLVLIEFLAQSLPFLAYDTGQVASTIKKDLPDSFVGNFILDDWAVHLQKVLRMDQQCLFEVYKKYFDPQEYVVKCINIYEEILST